MDASEREKAKELFLKISQAYDTLSDPGKRRNYDTFGDSSSQASEGYSVPRGQQGSYPGRRYGYYPADPFGSAGPHFNFQQPSPRTPPPAKRTFYCSLAELETGCQKKYELSDSWLRRVLDAIDIGWDGPGAHLAANYGMLAVSFLWRFPRVIFSGQWWIRASLFAMLWAAAVTSQLPASPTGVFEIKVRPGWRAGTRVVFSKDDRKIAFELRCMLTFCSHLVQPRGVTWIGTWSHMESFLTVEYVPRGIKVKQTR